MRKHKKGAIYFVSVIMVSLAIFIASRQNAYAVSQSDVVSQLSSLINQYNGKTATSGQMYNGIQCKGFANWVFLKIFGVYIGPYPESANYKISNPNAQTVGIIDPGYLTADSAKALLQKGYVGDYIQVRRRNSGGPHSMILSDVTDSGIWVFDCNSDNKNTIKYYSISWASFAASNSAMSLYHAYDYTSTPSDTNIYFSNPGMPGSIKAGTKYPVSGTVSSQAGIVDICIQLYLGNTMLHEAYYLPHANSYDISNLASGFPILDTPGIYHIFASAMNYHVGRKEIFNFYFIVLSDKETIPNGVYNIRTHDGSLSVDVEGHRNENGALMSLAANSDSPYQKYYISYAGSGYYTVTNCGTGNELDVSNGQTAAGTPVCQCIFTDNPAQYWQIIPLGDYFYFVPKCANNMCLNLHAWPDPISAGQKLNLWTPNYGNGERFTLVPTTYNSQQGERLSFDPQGGSLPTVSVTKPVTGMNKARGNADVIVYNVPNARINLNTWGAGVAVNSNGLVSDVCRYGESFSLVVPPGGFVLTAHISNNAVDDINALKVGQSVAFDYDNMAFSIYTLENDDGYLADSTYLVPGDPYGCLPVPTKDGYVFDGWYTQKDGGTRVNLYMECNAYQLYAHWKKPGQAEAAASKTYNGHTYELYDLPMSWHEAKAFCEEKGGNLVCITSQEENDAVLSLARQGAAGWYWLGCTDEETEGAWKWVSGEAFSYANWDPQASEPSGGTTENYGMIINRDNPPNKQAGEWNDAASAPSNINYYGVGNSGFICEYSVTPISSCTVTLSNTSYVYDGTDKTPDVSIKDKQKTLTLGRDYTVSYSNNRNAGTAQVAISGIGSYNGTATKAFTIKKAVPKLSFTGTSIVKTYGGAGFSNPLTAVTEGSITYRSSNEDVAQVAGNGQVAIQNAGTATITAHASASANYTEGSASYSLTVNKKRYNMAGVVFNSMSVAYDGAKHYLLVEGVLPEGVAATYQNNGQAEVGAYEVTAHFSGDSRNYEPIPDMKATLTILPVSTELFFQDKTVNKAFGDAAFINKITNTSGRKLTYSSSDESIAAVDAASGEVTIRKAGAVTITAFAPGTSQYTEASASYTLNIGKASYDMSQVQLKDGTAIYDGKAHSLSIEGVLPDGVAVEYIGNGQTEPGIYTVTAVFTGNENYEAIPDMSATLTITEREYGFAFEKSLVVKSYGEAPFSNRLITEYTDGTVQYSSSNLNVASVGQDGLVTITGSGHAAITAVIPDSGNGHPLSASYELEVRKGDYDLSQVIFSDQSCLYDGKSHSLEIQGALPEGVTVSYSGNNRVYPGEYLVTARFYGDEGNYNQIPVKSAILYIQKAKPGIYFQNSSITKKEGDGAFTNPLYVESDGALAYTSSNTKAAKVDNNGKITITGSGSSTITVSCQETDLYEAGTASFQLTITKTDGNSGSQGSPVRKIKLTGISKKVAAGKSITLNAAVSPASAKGCRLIWKSSSTKVATVTQKGKVTFKKNSGGKAVTITVQTAGGKVKATYRIQSMKGVVKKVSISGAKTVKAGKSLKLKAKATATSGANKTLSWKSSNTKYATVSSSGKVTAKKAGKGKKVKITATATDGSGKQKTVTIQIK